MQSYSFLNDSSEYVDATPTALFDFLDDQSNLSAHMSQSSGMMMGSTMKIQMEPDHTRNVGSHFGFTGRILGVPLRVDELVTSRQPPLSKTWETVGEPRLWVIGRYEMGFEIAPVGSASNLRVYIRYDWPQGGLPRLLGRLFGRYYARWCTGRMVSDARRHFAKSRITAPRTNHPAEA